MRRVAGRREVFVVVRVRVVVRIGAVVVRRVGVGRGVLLELPLAGEDRGPSDRPTAEIAVEGED